MKCLFSEYILIYNIVNIHIEIHIYIHIIISIQIDIHPPIHIHVATHFAGKVLKSEEGDWKTWQSMMMVVMINDDGDDDIGVMMLASSRAKDYFYEVAHLLGLLSTEIIIDNTILNMKI